MITILANCIVQVSMFDTMSFYVCIKQRPSIAALALKLNAAHRHFSKIGIIYHKKLCLQFFLEKHTFHGTHIPTCQRFTFTELWPWSLALQFWPVSSAPRYLPDPEAHVSCYLLFYLHRFFLD